MNSVNLPSDKSCYQNPDYYHTADSSHTKSSLSDVDSYKSSHTYNDPPTVDSYSLPLSSIQISVIGYTLSISAVCSLFSITTVVYMFLCSNGLRLEFLFLAIYFCSILGASFMYFLTYDIGNVITTRSFSDLLPYNSTYIYMIQTDMVISLVNLTLLPSFCYLMRVSEPLAGRSILLVIIMVSSLLGSVISFYAFLIIQKEERPSTTRLVINDRVALLRENFRAALIGKTTSSHELLYCKSEP